MHFSCCLSRLQLPSSRKSGKIDATLEKPRFVNGYINGNFGYICNDQNVISSQLVLVNLCKMEAEFRCFYVSLSALPTVE